MTVPALCLLGVSAALALSGCTEGQAPPPNPFASSSFFREGAGQPAAPPGPRVSSRTLVAPLCAGTALSSDRKRMTFDLVGQGRGGEKDGPDEVLRLARRDALSRALRCSGNRQIVRSFFDNVTKIGDREGQVISRDLTETMAALSRYEVVAHVCRVAKSGLSCRVRLRGEMRVEEEDPSFTIGEIALPHGGVLSEGEPLTVSFRLGGGGASVRGARPVRIYLFDVDARGEGFLLSPLPLPAGGASGGVFPGNARVTLPPPGAPHLRVALSPGERRTVERLFIVALRKGRLHIPTVKIAYGKNGPSLYRVKDFRSGVLSQLFRHRGPGSLWTMREIPFEIRGKAADDHPSADRTTLSATKRQRSFP
ncbi:MAG: hypothetical protein ACP5OS_08290 [Leptospirillia bacterium]